MTDEQAKQCTAKVKAMADVRRLAIEDTDTIINAYYSNLKSNQDKPLLKDLTAEEERQFAEKERELNKESEKRKLDEIVNAQLQGTVTA